MSVTINGTNGLTFNDASTQNTAATGFGFKNRIINGAMMVDQRNAGASYTPGTTTPYGSMDRWCFPVSQNSKFTVQQSSDAPAGFTTSMLITSSSAYSLGAGDYFEIQQRLEGFNTSDLAWGTASAKSVTLSFWVKSSLTGTFGGVFQNSTYNRCYPYTYTISAANTWEQKTVTIAGDTTGAWVTNNGVGLRVVFGLGVGSTYSGTAGAWASTDYESATGATSVVGTNGATFYITGVQLEKGSTATSFDYRPYGTELALCQRYYQKSWNQADAVPTSTAVGGIHVLSWGDGNAAGLVWPTAMRTSPTVTFYPTSSTTSGSVNSGGTDRSATANSPSERGFSYIAIVSGSANTYVRFQLTASAEL